MIKRKISNLDSNFLWNMMGSISTAAISVFLLLIVSRFLTAEDSDVFSFSYAFGNMLVVIATFQVRNFQATDTNKIFSFINYVQVRIFSIILSILVVVGYVVFSNVSYYNFLIVSMIALYRISDAVSDLFQGLFQQHQRLDIAGKLLFYRNFSISFIFALVIIFTNNLVLALVSLSLSSVIFIIIFEFPQIVQFEQKAVIEVFNSKYFARSRALLMDNLPLFINGFLLIFIYNQPKYSLEHIDVPGGQTVFNILFMPAFVMNLLMLFLRPLITQMAIYFQNNNYKLFRKIEVRIFLVLFVISLGILFLSHLVGLPLLSLIFGVVLNEYKNAFLILMVGGIFSSFATIFDNLLTIFRRQEMLLVPYGLAFIVSLLISNFLVTNYYLVGASWSFLISMVVWCLMSAIMYVRIRNVFLKIES